MSVALSPFQPAVNLQDRIDNVTRLQREILDKETTIALNRQQIESLNQINSPADAIVKLTQLNQKNDPTPKPLGNALKAALPGLTGFDNVKPALIKKAEKNADLAAYIDGVVSAEDAQAKLDDTAEQLRVLNQRLKDALPTLPSAEEKALQTRLGSRREALTGLAGDFNSKKAKMIEAKNANIAKENRELDGVAAVVGVAAAEGVEPVAPVERRIGLREQLATLQDQIANDPYAVLLPDQAARDAWSKDRRAQAIRALESDLVDMRRKLDAYEQAVGNAVPAPVQPCVLAMRTHLQAAGADVDQRAHRAVCHNCAVNGRPNNIKGIDRTADAKAAMRAKFQRLEVLAGLDAAPIGEAADYALAVALRNKRAAGGDVPGKMLGALIATSGAETRIYYAVSGTFEGTDAGAESGAGWAPSIPLDGAGAELQSIGGKHIRLDTLNTPQHTGTPHGVCSAPKLIQKALADGFTPRSMAEMWYGDGPNSHGEFVVSCSTCMKNVGFQLCNECTP